MQLPEIIKQKIKREGPISFRDYMGMALYYPELGYYTAAHNRIGANGDFYTSSSLGTLFGAVIAKQIEEMWRIIGEKEFTIVEQGAGNGLLCHDILDHLKDNKELYDNLHYCIIEKSPMMREKEQTQPHEKISWHNTVNELLPVTGCILSNELIDNFAVHRVVMKDELMEVFVDHDNGFYELLKPATQPVKDYLEELQIVLPYGYATEINLDAIAWIKEIATCMRKGYLMTIDYGHLSSELYTDCRHNGTLLCYNKHSVNDEPYQDIGEQDITSHVNFSALHHWGVKYGLHTCGFTNQAQFLLSMGINDHYTNGEIPHNYKMLHTQAFLRYTLLVDMGHTFKVLIQSKDTPYKPLSGLKHSPYTMSANALMSIQA